MFLDDHLVFFFLFSFFSLFFTSFYTTFLINHIGIRQVFPKLAIFKRLLQHRGMGHVSAAGVFCFFLFMKKWVISASNFLQPIDINTFGPFISQNHFPPHWQINYSFQGNWHFNWGMLTSESS